VYDLYIKEKETLKKYGFACVPNMKSSKFIRSIFVENDINNDINNDIIVECNYNKQFDKWEPVKHIPGGNVSDIKLLA
jgi:hypothetical protein